VSGVSFAISTSLFQPHRLDRDHLVDVAAHGFDGVEVFAERAHFDYSDPRAIAELSEWLDDTRLGLAAVHAPVGESIASTIASIREQAVAQTLAVVQMAAVLPFPYLVLHVGAPDTSALATSNDAEAARRSLEVILPRAESVGVKVALEVMTNRLSTPEALVALIDEVLDTDGAGICLDVGHARLLGDPVDAIESASGHVVVAHVHDTRGARDEHLVPYDGSIDWARTLLAFQKVGSSGPWTFELSPAASAAGTLARAASARQRFERQLGLDTQLMNP
jgi:sugar phosphate isomerase/epimerase